MITNETNTHPAPTLPCVFVVALCMIITPFIGRLRQTSSNRRLPVMKCQTSCGHAPLPGIVVAASLLAMAEAEPAFDSLPTSRTILLPKLLMALIDSIQGCVHLASIYRIGVDERSSGDEYCHHYPNHWPLH